jgi:hypothetical protein
MHISYHESPFGNYPFLLWGMLVPPLPLLSHMVQHHQYSLFLLPHLRFLVLKWGLKVHIRMMVWPFPSKVFYACKAFHFSRIVYIFFQYFSRLYHELHPTIDLHPSLLLLMPWILPKANNISSWIHCFLWIYCHNWRAWLPRAPP